MTPDQLKAAIESLLTDNGYELQVVIIDQRNGLDVTKLLAEQWQYAPLAQVVQVVKKNEPERGRTSPP